MLEILSCSIAEAATDIVRDTTINLTFNEEVAAASMTADNFILYIDDGGTYTGRHEIIINKNTETPTILVVSPSGDLSASTKYLLFVKGDTDVGDAVIQGVYSITGATMNGHFIRSFTTGTEYSDPDTTEPTEWEDPDSTNPGSSTATIPSVLRTSPYNGETVFRNLEYISVTFDQEIDPDIDFDNLFLVSPESADWPYDNVDEVYQASGFLLGSGYLDSSNTTLTYPVTSEMQSLPVNTLYMATLSSDIGNGSGFISSDYSWYFTSAYDPAYAHPRQIRQETGSSFNDVPDSIIWYFIHESSLLLEQKTGLSYDTLADVPFYANRFVICSTILKLYHALSGSTYTGGSIIEKTLGDLTIRYSSDGANNDGIPSWIEDCINTALSNLLGGRVRPATAVKSIYGYKYPGRRRSTI